MTDNEKELVATIKLSLLRAVVDLDEETLAMAIRVPKSEEPSEDCVSRQAVLDTKVLIELPDGQSFYCISPEDVEELPPVTPTQSSSPAIPLDKVKQARRELDKLPIYGAKFTDDFRIHFDREEVFAILDKLIESEE